jgi:acylphosphatase
MSFVKKELLGRSIRVNGKVQGVYFRQSAKEKSIELGINGWVRNEEDGSVYMEVCGNLESLDKLTEWVKDGPQQAQVTSVVTEDIQFIEFHNFMIRE